VIQGQAGIPEGAIRETKIVFDAEYPITLPINSLLPNVTINSIITTQQTIKENVTKPMSATTESRNVTIVSKSHITTNTLEKSTQANDLKEITKSSKSVKTTTIIYEPVREKGLEFEYVYIICVIMGIIILAIIIAVTNLCHYYKVIGKSQFDYWNPITVRSYSTRDNLELSETRL